MEPPRQGWITTEDGKVYATTRPDDIEEAQSLARTSPAKCGQLYDAVCENDFQKVKEILCWEDKSKEKVEFRKWYVNEKSWNDWRPLHAAAEAGLTEMAEFMVQCGADVNTLSNVKFTPLHLGKNKSISHNFFNFSTLHFSYVCSYCLISFFFLFFLSTRV